MLYIRFIIWHVFLGVCQPEVSGFVRLLRDQGIPIKGEQSTQFSPGGFELSCFSPVDGRRVLRRFS